MSPEIRPPPTADRQVTATNFEVFCNWLQDNGAICDGLTFGDDDSGMNGVILTKDFENDQTYASIPFKLMITEPLVRKHYPELSSLSSRAVMSLFLSNEWQKGKDSFWSPYLAVIPNRIMTSMIFNDDDMEILQGTNLQLGTISRRDFLQSEYEKILELVPESDRKGFTWEVCLWGYTAISSRAFPYRLIDSKATGEMMVPLADSFNHDPSVKVTWSGRGTADDGVLDLITRDPLKAGNQIFTTYGPKSNEERYGFCIEGNEHDYVALKPNFTRDPNAAAKKQILEKCNLLNDEEENSDRELVFYVTRKGIPDDLLAVFRVLVMNEIETTHYLSVDQREYLDFIGYRNEYAMVETLHKLLTSKLLKLKNAELNLNAVNEWQKSAMYYRTGQIIILDVASTNVWHMKQKLLARMQSNFRSGRIAKTAPFLRILNQDEQELLSPSYKDDPETEAKPENNILITVKEALRLDEEFAEALKEGYPRESIPYDDEPVNTMLLVLIREKSKQQSRWRRFLNTAQRGEIELDEEAEEYLQHIYIIVLKHLVRRFPDHFPNCLYNMESLRWADQVFEAYSVRTGELPAIIPM